MPLSLTLRRGAALAALVAAGVHIPVIPEHLEEAPYVGVLFILLTVACVGLAAALLITDAPIAYAVAAVICAAAVFGYILSRVVALPMLAEDLGDWFDPFGVAAVISETIVVLVCALALRRRAVRNR